MASPHVSGKALFLRTRTHLYRVEKELTGGCVGELRRRATNWSFQFLQNWKGAASPGNDQIQIHARLDSRGKGMA